MDRIHSLKALEMNTIIIHLIVTFVDTRNHLKSSPSHPTLRNDLKTYELQWWRIQKYALHCSTLQQRSCLSCYTALLLGSEIFGICTEFALVIKVWKQTIVFWDLFPGFLKIDERNNCFDVEELELLSSFPKRTSFERKYLRVVRVRQVDME